MRFTVGYYLTIKRWSGTDQRVALETLASVFRCSPEKANEVLRGILAGQPWRFEHSISNQQAPLAKTHLGSFGFVVELSPTGQHEKHSAPAAAKTSPTKTVKEPVIEKPASPATSLNMGFHGDGFDFFKIQLTNILLIIATLGIYSFWAKIKTRQFLYANTSLGSDRFVYHGTAKELFKGQTKFIGLILLAGFIMGLVADSAPPMIAEALSLVSYIIFSLAIPVLMVGAIRYRLARTSLRGIRFSFRGQYRPAIILYLKGILLTVLTLGCYYPFFMIQVRDFVCKNSYYGHMPFTFNGEGKDVFRQFLLTVLLTIPTLGIYWFWYKAYMQSYIWSHTGIGAAQFRFTATGADWFKLNLVNLLLLAVTLGIATPWIIVRNHKFIADHLTLEGTANLDQSIQEMKNSGALGDVALDDLDIAIDAF